jgi:hypothetical protein
MSDIQVDRKLEEAIAKAQSPEEIVILMHEAAVAQNLVPKEVLGYREDWNPKAAETTPAQKFTRRENIGGRDFDFTASSEAELDRAIADARKVAEAVQPRDAQGRFASAQDQGRADEEAAQRAELENQFRLGLITAEQFVEKSGVINQYLGERGIDVAEIQEAQGRRYEQSWKEASDEFIKTAEGRTWPGGEKNLEILGMKLVALGLQDAKDKVAALKSAYEDMKKNGTIFPTDGAVGAAVGSDSTGPVTEEDFKNAQSYEELHQLARRANGQDPSDAAHSRAWAGR